MLTRLCAIAASALLTSGCSDPLTGEWTRCAIDLSGKKISVSGPPGSTKDHCQTSVDLSNETRDYVPLFKRAWLIGGLIGDRGGAEVDLVLARYRARDPKQSFFEAVQEDYRLAYMNTPMHPVRLMARHKRSIGEKDWECFRVTAGGSECALEVNDRYFVTWRADWISNRGSARPERLTELFQQMEKGVEIAF